MSGYAPDPSLLMPGSELIRKPFLRGDLFRAVHDALNRKQTP
jgi:hypothetical protein